MNWYTSDWHLGHTNIAGPKISNWPDGFRDFDSVQKMDTTIIETCNSYVGQNDVLYHLGDFSLGYFAQLEAYRRRLVVKTIHHIKGNHDKWKGNALNVFDSTRDVLMLKTPLERYSGIFMSHYSHRVWPKSHRGAIHLYGHSHGSIPDHGKSMDVGIDVAYKMFGEYRPFSQEEIFKIMDKKEVSYLDHHRERE